MPQLLVAILIIVVVKLLIDAAKPAQRNSKRSAQGDFIDVSENWIQADVLPYQPKDALFGNQELELFKLLQEILAGTSYEIYPHVRLSDLLKVPPGTKNRKEYQLRIDERSVDLLVVDVSQAKPRAGINLFASGDGEGERLSREFAARALASAGIKSMTMNPMDATSREKLAADLRSLGIPL